jgi:hypothetical protein
MASIHTIGKGEVHHQIRDVRYAPSERGGESEPRHKRGEVRSNHAVGRILWLASVSIIIIIYNIFTSNNISINEGFRSDNTTILS